MFWSAMWMFGSVTRVFGGAMRHATSLQTPPPTAPPRKPAPPPCPPRFYRYLCPKFITMHEGR